MKLLDKYFKLQKEIYDYFGYVEDWVVIPIDDCRDYFWKLHEDKDEKGEKNGSGRVVFSEDKNVAIEEKGDHYESEIYTQRFLPKWIYRKDDYTMICTNP